MATLEEHPWWSDEQTARGRFEPALADHLAKARDCEEIGFDLAKIQSLRHPEDVFRVHATLLVRALNDLRCCTWLGVYGYTMQAWAIAASCYEAAHGLGFIGLDEERARRWLDHRDTDNAPIPAFDGVVNTLSHLGIETNSARRAELVKQEFQLYRYLCMAKHINPVPERSRYWIRGDAGLKLRFPPFFHESRLREARLGLTLAVRSAATALWIFDAAHVAAPGLVDSRITSLMESTGALLEKWHEDASDRREAI